MKYVVEKSTKKNPNELIHADIRYSRLVPLAMPLVEHLSSSPVFSEVRVAQT